MSRIGRLPIEVPAGVTVSPFENGLLTVKGPKGSLTQNFNQDLSIKQEGAILLVERPSDAKEHRSLHGLTRTLVSNMVTGVSKGYEKQLEIQGVGFRAAMIGDLLQLNVGFSHTIEVLAREGITLTVANDPQSRNPVITVSGIDKQRVGQLAAEIRKLRKPEPYKGKGIRYKGEAGGKGAKKK